MSPSNYFNTLRGAWSDFYGPSGLLQFGLSCLLKLRRLGPSCLGPTFLWAELSWADLSLGRVVLNPIKTAMRKDALRFAMEKYFNGHSDARSVQDFSP